MIFFRPKPKTTERSLAFEGDIITRYKFASRFVQDKDVLDVGTGFGHGAYYLARKNAKTVLGIDYYKPAIDQAKKTFSPDNLFFEVRNALDVTSLKKYFDVIIAFEIIEHLPLGSCLTFVKKTKKILKPRGLLIISTPNKLISSPGRVKPLNPYHTEEFTPKKLLKLTKKCFSNPILMGMKNINKEYLKKDKIIKKRVGSQLATFVSRYKLTHELLPFIPKRIKQLATSRNQLPALSPTDFEISTKNIEKCEGLLVFCKN